MVPVDLAHSGQGWDDCGVKMEPQVRQPGAAADGLAPAHASSDWVPSQTCCSRVSGLKVSVLSLACVTVPWVPSVTSPDHLLFPVPAAPGTPRQGLEVHPVWWRKDELQPVLYG